MPRGARDEMAGLVSRAEDARGAGLRAAATTPQPVQKSRASSLKLDSSASDVSEIEFRKSRSSMRARGAGGEISNSVPGE